MTTTHNAPEAQVVSRSGIHVTVECPYCGNHHQHELRTGRGRERRAPGCGMVRTPDQRLVGYWFTT